MMYPSCVRDSQVSVKNSKYFSYTNQLAAPHMQVYILIADDTVKLVNNILCTFVV